MNICFIGFGNMAKAIANSLYKQGKAYKITACAPSLKEGQTPEGIITEPDSAKGVTDAELVILAVKPAKVVDALQSIRATLPKDCLLVSVAAGVSLNLLEQHCSANQAIIRSMPNTPLAIGKGATPLIANQFVNQQQKRWAEELFECAGIITWVQEEKEIDSFTALSGSGPAYVFLFIEAMIDAAIKLGLNDEIAKQFALQTVIGAAELAKGSELSIPELRKKVTSPAGTTAAAIAILEKGGFAELLSEAMDAAYNRAKQLGMATA